MIEVKNVSMSFRLSQDRIQSIKEYLVALAKGKLKYKEFWALKNVSFTVRGAGNYWPKWSGQKHDFKGDFRHFKADRGICVSSREYCADAGIGERL